MTEPTPTKEQIEAATDIYNTVTFDIGLTGANGDRDKIAAVLVAREQAARKEALEEAAMRWEKDAAYIRAKAANRDPGDLTIRSLEATAREHEDIATEILALIDKGE